MRKPQLPRFAPFVLVAALAVGCGSVDNAAEPEVLGVVPAGEYVVTGITDGGTPRALVGGSEIRFTFEDGHLGIRAGCNGMGGDFTLDGSRMTVRGIGGTDMGCEQALMDQDAWVAGLFDEPVQLKLGKDAAIVAGDVVLTMSPREEVHPDKPLIGTQWVFDTVIDGDSASSVPNRATVRITARELVLKDNCSGGGVDMKIEGSHLVFGSFSPVLNLCEVKPSLTEHFRTVLHGTAIFDIAEDRLTITNGDHALGFRAAR